MNIGPLKLRYRLAAVRSKASLFARHPAALLFYARHYAVEKRVARRFAVTVVSYPKSGRTWLEQLLLAALGHHLGLRFGEDATYAKVAAGIDKVPLIGFTHAGGSWETATLTAAEIATHVPARIGDGRFVYLYRDPRDVLVSAYHHARNRSGIAWLRPQDMLDDPIVGLPKVTAFMNNWTRQVEGAPGRAMRVSYEALKATPQQTLGELCRFMALPFSEDEIGQAIADCSFERLQQRELAATGGNPWLAPVDPANRNSFKFREGRSGSYRTFFSADQIAWIDDYLAKHLLQAGEYLSGGVSVRLLGTTVTPSR
jgi:hypothetical protein